MTEEFSQPRSSNRPLWRWIVTLALLASITLTWTQTLDQPAADATSENFKQALAVAAIARVFNGVISVAQGTELAISPVGVGVTLTLGEVLDPLNDLIERFSVLALIASVSLSLQLLMGEMVLTPALSALLTGAAIIYLTLLWWPRAQIARRWPSAMQVLAQLVGAIVLLRFLLAVMLLATNWIDGSLLEQRQVAAIERLETASLEAKSVQDQQNHADLNELQDQGIIDRAKNLLNTTSEQLDLQQRLERLQHKVASSVEDIVLLIVIFLLQTLLLPIASAYLTWWLLRGFWRQATTAITR
ncbi:MAG: hypothetical protein AAF541_20810 [Pseudomonadota bacterium]